MDFGVLLERSLIAGLSYEEFWRSDFKKIDAVTRAHEKSIDLEMEMNAWLAWHIGILTRQDPKKYPKKPKDLIAPEQQKEKFQSLEHMKFMAKALTAAMGGRMKKRKR